MITLKTGFKSEFPLEDFIEPLDPLVFSNDDDELIKLRKPIWHRGLKSLGIHKKFEMVITYVIYGGEHMISLNMIFKFKTKEEAMLFKLSHAEELNFYEDIEGQGTKDNPIKVS